MENGSARAVVLFHEGARLGCIYAFSFALTPPLHRAHASPPHTYTPAWADTPSDPLACIRSGNRGAERDTRELASSSRSNLPLPAVAVVRQRGHSTARSNLAPSMPIPTPGLPYGSSAYWDARYATHDENSFAADEWYGPSAVAAVRAAVAALALPSGTTALEIGCGAGHLADDLAAEFSLSLTATDISPTAIAKRKEADSAGLITWAVADATALPFSPSSFSVVIDKGVCDALDCDDDDAGLDRDRTAPARALAEAARVLPPGGSFILASCRDPSARAVLLDPLFRTVSVVEVWGGEPGRPRPPCPEAFVYTLVRK